MYDINYTTLLEDDATFEVIYDKARQFRYDDNVVECSSRYFNSSVETIVTKWDLVCSERVLYANGMALMYAGILVEPFAFGYIVDQYGRAVVYKVTLLGMIIAGFATCFSFNFAIFVTLKVVVSVLATGFYMSGFIIVMEMCSLSKRTIFANYVVLPWAIGIMLSALISYVVRPWRYLQAALTVPGLFLLPSFWLLPESPRWLILKGRYEEAYSVLHSIATSNSRTLPEKQILFATMKTIRKLNEDETGEPENVSFKRKILHFLRTMTSLVANSKLRRTTLAMFFCWFSVSMVYYGATLGSTALSTDPYLYIFLGGLLELISYLLLWPIVESMGRKRAVIIFFFLAGFSILSMMVIVIYTEKRYLSWLKTTLFLLGKFSVTGGFHLLWVFTAELYPTEVRSLAIGQCSTASRLGSICSPYINNILGLVTLWAPAAIFGVLSIFSGVIAFALSDTSGVALSETLEKKAGTPGQKPRKTGVDRVENVTFVPVD